MGEKEAREVSPDIKLYKLSELEEALGIGHRTLWKYVRAGKIRATKVANKWYVSETNVKKFLESGAPEE